MPRERIKYLRPTLLAQLHDEAKNIDEMLQHDRSAFEDVGAARRRRQVIQQQIDAGTPPDTNPEQRSIIAKTERQLRREMMDGMPSQEEMRRNPRGAVSKHLDWERRNKAKLEVWRNCTYTLMKGATNDDIGSFERFRPRTSTLGMHDAAIPKTREMSFPSEQFKANYDLIDWEKERDLMLDDGLDPLAEPPEDRAETLIAELAETVEPGGDVESIRAAMAQEDAEAARDAAAQEALDSGVQLPPGLRDAIGA